MPLKKRGILDMPLQQKTLEKIGKAIRDRLDVEGPYSIAATILPKPSRQIFIGQDAVQQAQESFSVRGLGHETGLRV
jgi:hypothetical protein